MKMESRKCINISKIVEHLSEVTLQQNFLKLKQLQGMAQLLFYMVLGKLKFLLMSKWKINTLAIGVLCWKVYSNSLLHRNSGTVCSAVDEAIVSDILLQDIVWIVDNKNE